MASSHGELRGINGDVLEQASLSYWEREAELLNSGLSLIFGYFSPRGLFRIGYRVAPRLLKGRFHWIIELEPLGIGLTRLPKPGGLFIDQGGRSLCVYSFRHISSHMDQMSEEEAGALGAPRSFLSYYKSYTQEGSFPLLGHGFKSRIYRVPFGRWVATISEEGERDEVPWLLWDSLGGLSSLLPSKI